MDTMGFVLCDLIPMSRKDKREFCREAFVFERLESSADVVTLLRSACTGLNATAGPQTPVFP